MSDVIVFKNEKIVINVTVEEETLWLTQKELSELFGVTVATINEHIKNIYKEEELTKDATIRKFLIVRQEGKREVKREIEHYNLDLILSVGYRVKSKIATKFRQWASKILKQYLFILFLHKNGILHKANGEPKINDNALASLALLVATSAPEQKEIIIKLVMNMLYEGDL